MLFGDGRFRSRLRLRFGGAYQANKNWAMGYRLAYPG
jgi:hypothetical protein